MEARGLELREAERGVFRARGDGPFGGGIVPLRRDGDDRIGVAVPLPEDGLRDVRPAPRCARARAAVGAIGRMGAQEMEYGCRHVLGEGEASQLVVHDRDMGEAVSGIRAPVGERRHRLHEVAAIAYDPGGAQDVVLRASRHGKVACRLGLAVDGEGAEGLVLRMGLPRPVEDVVRGDVDEADAVPSHNSTYQTW